MQEATILLIDDNPDDIDLARRAVARRNSGTTLEAASSGREALERLNGNGNLPRAIFLDINMPEWNGFDVLRRLRENERTRHVPVVMLTTSNEPRDVLKSYELGANSYVPKPLDFDEFTEVFAATTRYWSSINEVTRGGA